MRSNKNRKVAFSTHDDKSEMLQGHTSIGHRKYHFRISRIFKHTKKKYQNFLYLKSDFL